MVARILLSAVAGLVVSTQAFAPSNHAIGVRRVMSTAESTAEVAAPKVREPPTAAELKSETGADFMPLATALMNGEFKEADQMTRDLLIFIAGPGPRSRNFVYFTEVPKIPDQDLITMENLWLKYSDGKFGYSVQRRFFLNAKMDFEAFCRKIDWNLMDEGLERKRRWFGADEFIYELDKAPAGHLPLTSALRGTQLIKAIYKHPVWEQEQFADSGKGKFQLKKK